MLSNEKWFGAEAGFYPETIDQSLRFEDGDSPQLSKTPSGTGNRKTFTISFWFKRGNIGSFQELISAYDNSSANNSTWFGVAVRADDTFTVNGWSNNWRITNRVFRDTTNWYHAVVAVDSTQSTANDRIKIYINGVQETSFSSTVNENQNHDYGWNNTIEHRVGSVNYSTNNYYFDGYLAEVNVVDGTQLDETSFGETKNGVWIPKSLSSLTYGTNGFRFTFADSSSLGDDTSGNTNDFTSSGLASTDVSNDSPTNNFCTMNTLQKGAYISLSEGNLKVAGNNATNSAVALGTFAQTSGKWYFEVRQGTVSSEFIGVMVKQVSFENSLIDGSNVAQTQGKGVVIRYNGDVRGISGELQSVSAFTYTAGDIIGIAFDMDNGAVYFAKNNTWLNSGDPTSGSSKTGSFLNFTVDDTRIATPALDSYTGGFVTGNFGQDSSFAGTETAQGNSDENGQGDFYYTPPSGYLALCSSNLPDTTLSPNQAEQATDYFNTVLYTANNQTAQSITGVGFQPDWLWFKQRSRADAHAIFDSSRGTNKPLRIATDSEFTNATLVTSIDSDGFTLGTDTFAWVNYQSDTMVAWNWKANGGTTSTDTNGDVNSTVQVSSDAKFSIVTFTGSASASTAFTVGHGLGSPPKLIIAKQRNASSSWLVYHHQVDSTAPEGYYMLLNTTGAKTASSTAWGNTAPTSTVFTTYTTGIWGTSAEIVAYCFDEVEGYSKFGTYTGNGSTDGTYVHLGFRPSWIIVKRINSGYSWIMNDNKRDPINEVDLILIANDTGAENGSSTVDFDWLSNGFKCKNSNSNINTNGSTYIYMAFAEQPFKFSNAR